MVPHVFFEAWERVVRLSFEARPLAVFPIVSNEEQLEQLPRHTLLFDVVQRSRSTPH